MPDYERPSASWLFWRSGALVGGPLPVASGAASYPALILKAARTVG